MIMYKAGTKQFRTVNFELFPLMLYLFFIFPNHVFYAKIK